MFELEHRHITKLTDEALRTVVGMLCERHLREAVLSESAVTYGGDQRASDGGVDVRVNLPLDAKVGGWVPRPRTVFQVKQEKNGLPPAAITAEMCPKGTPRPVFAKLAADCGAYIIVSGMETLSDEALARRRHAMEQAVADVPGAAGMLLDVYDGHRIARWANSHPGVVQWVRHQIGEPLQGWRPFGDWTATPQLVESTYIVDDKGRLFDGSAQDNYGLPIVDGLDRIRASLAHPGVAVRLVGLSGMGKTRLVQALFDERIGCNALDPALAVYGDVGVELDPSPQSMLTRLLADGRRAVLIVDNCLPSLHSVLAAKLRAAKGSVSLITVEYDVGGDEHEETAVFRLEPASNAVIEHLITRTHPHIVELDRWHIAELSEGNARLALALAATVPRGDSIAFMSRGDLFDRLFHQRNDKSGDQALLRAAEACALVYSFDGKTDEGEGAELPLLAELAGQQAPELYRHVAELASRHLVQMRDRWRAVLPQALAIHLARKALDTILLGRLRRIMEERAPQRLLRSFTRRLGYLHDSEAARDIVGAWLAPGGRLHDVARLTPEDWAMFENVAPVRPDLVLDLVEGAADREGDAAFFAAGPYRRSALVRLLHALAYEPDAFARAAWLMIRALATEAPDNNHYSARGHVEALFALYLSGTHASQNERLRLIDGLMKHPEARFNQIAMTALGAMLNAGHFSSTHHHSFGAHPRDHGWQPKTDAEQAEWYRVALARAVELAISDSSYTRPARSMIADQFRSLWSMPLLSSHVEAAVRAIAEHGFWDEGWKAVCMTIAFDRKEMPAESLNLLQALESSLRPASLEEMVRAYALSDRRGIGDLIDTEVMEDLEDYAGAEQRLAAKVRELGRSLAIDDGALDNLLPELVSEQGDRTYIFGHSLGDAAADIDTFWRRLVAAFTAAAPECRNSVILRSVLRSASTRDADWTDKILDDAVSDPVLGPCFPSLQIAVPIGKAGVRRLRRALIAGLAPIKAYEALGCCGPDDGLCDEDLAALLVDISGYGGGNEVALEVLSFRLTHVRNIPEEPVSPELTSAGRSLLGSCDLSEQSGTHDYRLSKVVKICLPGADGVEAARSLCHAIKAAKEDYWRGMRDFGRTWSALASVQPAVFLEVFLGSEADHTASRLSWYTLGRIRNPLLAVPRDALFAWADGDPERRYPQLAGHLGLFAGETGDETKSEEPPSPIVLALLDRAPDKAAVLAVLEGTLMPRSWSGNLSDLLENRRKRMSSLLAHADAAVKAWAEEADRKLAHWADAERKVERERSQREQSFE